MGVPLTSTFSGIDNLTDSVKHRSTNIFGKMGATMSCRIFVLAFFALILLWSIVTGNLSGTRQDFRFYPATPKPMSYTPRRAAERFGSFLGRPAGGHERPGRCSCTGAYLRGAYPERYTRATDTPLRAAERLGMFLDRYAQRENRWEYWRLDKLCRRSFSMRLPHIRFSRVFYGASETRLWDKPTFLSVGCGGPGVQSDVFRSVFSCAEVRPGSMRKRWC